MIPTPGLLAWTLAATTSLRCLASPVVIVWGLRSGSIKGSTLGPLARPYLGDLKSDVLFYGLLLLLFVEIAADKADVEMPLVDAIVLVLRPFASLMPPLLLLPEADPSTLVTYAAAYGISGLQVMNWILTVTGHYAANGWRPAVQYAVSLARDLVASFCAFLALRHPVVAAGALFLCGSAMGPIATKITNDVREQERAAELAKAICGGREPAVADIDVLRKIQG